MRALPFIILAPAVAVVVLTAFGCNDCKVCSVLGICPDPNFNCPLTEWGGNWTTVEDLGSGLVLGAAPPKPAVYDPNLQWKLNEEECR